MKKRFDYRYSVEKALSPLAQLDQCESELIRDDVARTRQFITSVFEEYEHSGLIEPVNYAFLIPTRASRHIKEYWLEVYEFLPAYQHISPSDAFYSLSSLPPFRIEMYGKQGSPSSGVLIFVPVFSDMLKDYKNRYLLLRSIRKKINESVDFAHKKFGVTFVGLGATLPKLTNYGKAIKANVVTTTGHAGTTWLLKETVVNAINKRPYLMSDKLKIGFIGGGAIGLAAMQSLSKIYPNAEFITYDIREKINTKNVKIMKKAGIKLKVAKSNHELIGLCSVVVSAITSKVLLEGIDLSGKVIIDDSQPGSFNRDQVIMAGGELIWVVGEDDSDDSFVTRRQGYSYGPHGLHSSSDLWGCEAEVAAIAHANKKDAAVNDAVRQEDIDKIDALFKKLNVRPAKPQSHGQLNN